MFRGCVDIYKQTYPPTTFRTLNCHMLLQCQSFNISLTFIVVVFRTKATKCAVSVAEFSPVRLTGGLGKFNYDVFFILDNDLYVGKFFLFVFNLYNQ